MSPTFFASIVALAIVLGGLAVAAVIVTTFIARDERRLQRRAAGREAAVSDEPTGRPRSLLQGIAQRGRAIELMVDPKGESQRLLVQAGWRDTQSRIGYYVLQALVPVVMAVLVFAGVLFGKGRLFEPPMIFVLAFAAFAVSILLPRMLLRSIAKSRLQRIKREVPLFVHLLIMLFDSGLSTRQALNSLVQDGANVLPELQKEVELIVRQLEAGGEIGTILRNLEEVLAVGDLTTILGVLRQVDRFGGEIREPLLDTLKVIEERRGLDMREKVNIISGRMTVVMVLFFFPALLIFAAGPAFLAIIRAMASTPT